MLASWTIANPRWCKGIQYPWTVIPRYEVPPRLVGEPSGTACPAARRSLEHGSQPGTVAPEKLRGWIERSACPALQRAELTNCAYLYPTTRIRYSRPYAHVDPLDGRIVRPGSCAGRHGGVLFSVLLRGRSNISVMLVAVYFAGASIDANDKEGGQAKVTSRRIPSAWCDRRGLYALPHRAVGESSPPGVVACC